MKAALAKLLSESTVGDLKLITGLKTPATMKTFVCAKAVRGIFERKPNMFLQFIQSEEITNARAHTNVHVKDSGDGGFIVEHTATDADSLGLRLRKALKVYEEKEASTLLNFKYPDDMPLLDAVAIALLKNTTNPGVLGKVLAVFDIVGDDVKYKIKKFEVSNNQVKEVTNG